jgi:hypothetical protein
MKGMSIYAWTKYVHNSKNIFIQSCMQLACVPMGNVYLLPPRAAVVAMERFSVFFSYKGGLSSVTFLQGEAENTFRCMYVGGSYIHIYVYIYVYIYVFSIVIFVSIMQV